MAASRRAIWRRALVTLTVLLVAQMLLVPVVSACGCPMTYRVRFGDTLFSIARRFGVSVSAIVQANRRHRS